jgi:hypothetical protein
MYRSVVVDDNTLQIWDDVVITEWSLRAVSSGIFSFIVVVVVVVVVVVALVKH